MGRIAGAGDTSRNQRLSELMRSQPSRREAGLGSSTEDAMIAAIALTHAYPLATRNTKDFLGIDGLNLINPWHTT